MQHLDPHKINTLSRRTLLAASVTAVGASVVGCGSGGQPEQKAASQQGDLTPPAHVPYTEVKPDLPPGGRGVPAGFFNFPEPPLEMGKVPLPSIAPISMLLQGNAPAVPFKKNSMYKKLTTDAGAEFEIAYGGYTEYQDKFQVTMASDDLPDVVMMIDVPQLPKLLEAKFTDLSEFLSGDKVKDYPGLASISEACWEVPVLNGGLWGVSKARPSSEGKVMLARGDLLEKKGISSPPELTDGPAFLSLLEELSDPKNDRFAMGADPTSWLMPLLLEMHGAPNGWSEKDGKFVHVYESDEMTAALEQAAKIWKSGYLHPKSISEAGSNYIWWEAGTTALYIDGVAGWSTHARTQPEWGVDGVVVPAWEGGGPAPKHEGSAGYGAYAAIRKQESKERVEEILRVMDYIAAPFGTQEWLSVNFGVEDKHFTMKNGNPLVTDLFDQEAFAVNYLGSQSGAQLYVPEQPEVVKRQYEYLTAVMGDTVQDASTKLYSETAVSRGASEQQKIVDTQLEIIQGRRPVSDWKSVADGWTERVGNRTREEYQEALASTR